MHAARSKRRLQTFALEPGRPIGSRYKVVQKLGGGVEGEVYQILERDTRIHRAAKLYFPHRDPKHRSTIWYARKLNTLRHCPIVLQYHHTEIIEVGDRSVRCLISELCEGEQLEKWIARHRGGRLQPFQALHVVYRLVRGLEAIHLMGEYHSDVHSQNILIKPRGVGFELKLVDFYDWGKPARYKQQQDIIDSVRVLHECVGGRAQYRLQPPEVKAICMGLQWKRVLKRFPTITALRRHLEMFDWQTTLL